ncbi:MAG: DoxX family membrane protein [Kiritimatiellae bacterium]|nr:DoxX family membrane protein [Kiritimatiellia bacterium]
MKRLASVCIDTCLRLGLGAMFLYSAWGKIADPGAFQTIVANYGMLPPCLTGIFALVMPMVELLTGLLFICTKWTREAAFATLVMLLMFIVALAQAQIRGLDISCGCFKEAEGEGDTVLVALVRDLVLVIPALWLLFKGQQRWIVDYGSTSDKRFP